MYILSTEFFTWINYSKSLICFDWNFIILMSAVCIKTSICFSIASMRTRQQSIARQKYLFMINFFPPKHWIVGYNIGVMNSPSHFMKNWCNQTVIQRYDKHLTVDQLETLWSTVISIFLVGGCVGSLFAASLADKFGRFVSHTKKILRDRIIITKIRQEKKTH